MSFWTDAVKKAGFGDEAIVTVFLVVLLSSFVIFPIYVWKLHTKTVEIM